MQNIQFRASAGANPIIEYEIFNGLIPSGTITKVISSDASITIVGTDSIRINSIDIPDQTYRFNQIIDTGGVPFADIVSANTYLTNLFSDYITGSRSVGGGGGGGDASAANQLVEIGHLANIVANQTNGSQISQINDGAGDALNINPDGSINVVFPSATNLYGDLQTTSNFSLLNCSFINQKNDLLFTELTAGGSTISVTGNGLNFSCGNLQACYIKSRARLHYMKGVPLTAEFTVSKMYFQTAGPGFKMVGFYSYEITPDVLKNFAGIYARNNAGTPEVNFRVIRNGSEVFSQDVTNYADWLNGGVICRVTYLWLGFAGAVLQIRNVNTGAWDTVSVFNYPPNIAPFFSESDLFFGAGMDNNSGATEEFNLLCVNIFRAGQENLIGNPLALSNNSTVTCNTTGTRYCLLAFKKTDFYSVDSISVFLNNVKVAMSTNDLVRVELILNPTFSAPPPLAIGTILETFAATSPANITVTGGTIVYTDTFNQSGAGEFNPCTLPNLGENFNGVQDTWAVVLTPLTGGVTVFATSNFQYYQ